MRVDPTKKKTIAQVVIERVGFTKAYRVQVHTVCWWIATASLGHPPETVDEYADWWLMNRRKAFRDQEVFRKAWPEFETPAELAAALDIDPLLMKFRKTDQSKLTIDLLGWAAP